MIPFDFQYYRPDTIEEATTIFKDLRDKKLSPIYYGGGTEIITQARKQMLSTGAVIDIKQIPDCKVHEERDEQLIFGAGLTLTEIIEKNLFPFFSKACRPIADHTVRNKLTLGGNICGKLPYREAILPLLVVDTVMVLAGAEGIREVPIREAFDKRLLLKDGEFLVQVKVPKDVISYPYFNRRREKHTSVDYPLINIVAIQKEGKIQMAFSGVSALPFRSQEAEDLLNKKEHPLEERISNAIDKLPLPIKKDHWASSEYRKALLKKSMNELMSDLEGVSL